MFLVDIHRLWWLRSVIKAAVATLTILGRVRSSAFQGTPVSQTAAAVRQCSPGGYHKRPLGRPARARPQAAHSKRDRPGRAGEPHDRLSDVHAAAGDVLDLIEENSATHAA
jgi:hypothetical protein